MPLRTFSAEPLTVNSSLVGQALASPGRRLLAFLLDGLLLAVPTLGTAVGAAGLALFLTDRPALDAVLHLARLGDANPAVAREEARRLVPLLVRLRAPGLPAPLAASFDQGDLEGAAAALAKLDIVVTLSLNQAEPDEDGRAGTVVLPIERLIPTPVRAVALLFVPGLYFAAFTRGRHGATIGKRLLGLRVARLDGRRLGWLEAIERFGGYVQIPASGFLGLLDLWRDPNRRLAHDRGAHTVVLRIDRGMPKAGPAGRAGVAPRPGGPTDSARAPVVQSLEAGNLRDAR